MSLHAEGDFLFPVTGVDFASDERKLYYKELVSFAREELVGIPEGYLQYLKELFSGNDIRRSLGCVSR